MFCTVICSVFCSVNMTGIKCLVADDPPALGQVIQPSGHPVIQPSGSFYTSASVICTSAYCFLRKTFSQSAQVSVLLIFTLTNFFTFILFAFVTSIVCCSNIPRNSRFASGKKPPNCQWVQGTAAPVQRDGPTNPNYWELLHQFNNIFQLLHRVTNPHQLLHQFNSPFQLLHRVTKPYQITFTV